MKNKIWNVHKDENIRNKTRYLKRTNNRTGGAKFVIRIL